MEDRIRLFDPERTTINIVYPDGRVVPEESLKPKKLHTAADILHRDYQPINWIIPDLLPEGLTILAGRPKSGKSWLALNMAIAVANGEECFCFYRTNRSGVFFISYEDNFRRLRYRMKMILGDYGISPKNLYFYDELHFPKLNAGGTEELLKQLDEHKDISLVIIDTLGAGMGQTRQAYGNAFLEEYDFMNKLQKVALERKIGIIVIHHTRKAEAEDVFDTVSGTTGITASADTLMVLRKRNEKCTLHLRGRDVNEGSYAIIFNEENGTWRIEGKEREVQASAAQQEILDVFVTAPEQEFSLKEITEITGKKKTTISNLLIKMKKNGLLAEGQSRKYKLEDTQYK